MKLVRILFALWLMLMTASAMAVFDVGQLMADLASNKGGKARFTETRYLAVLDKPVISTGELSYQAPDQLEKRTISPRLEILQLNGDILNLERNQKKLSIQLSRHPEALAFVDSIRGTLSGNRVALERNYAIRISGTPNKWTLTLLPNDQLIATVVLRITIAGSKQQIHTIEYLQADGDRSIMSIEHMETR